MIEIRNKQILIDGKPQIIMSGEIHYYRVHRRDWQDRINKLKAAGCNTVASYIPWLCHEQVEGQFDFDGKTRPELNLSAFIDLCKGNGLYFFARTGPFIMAEMKNEGLPYWVYAKHPEIIPVSWDGKKVPTKTVDYLAPGFLEEVHKWYAGLMPIIASRLITKGGNIIGVQLDNEVGMLSWVSNCPDLTDNVITDFISWLKKQYTPKEIIRRYPFDTDNIDICGKAFRSPEEEYVAEFTYDLGHYMRNRFARYIALLRSYAEEFGVEGIPFIVNVHGTGGGRGLTFPIGISQLYEAYTQAPGYISGSDIYLGNLTMDNFQDLYLINGFMDAVNNSDQPLTSVEFECGDGNYGCTYGGRYDPSAADFKARMCIAQGNRMLNYYLFAGGTNYRLDPKPDDGNDRIAFTGERHGFAAPVSPEGELDYVYPRLARSTKTIMAVSSKLSEMKEEHDNVAFAFIPDYYMTESRYPWSDKMAEIIKDVERRRASGAWEIMARAMLLSCYRFGSVDIQNRRLDPESVPVLALASACYMDGGVQQKIVDYLNDGGGILLYGEVPIFDMEGNPCTILADAMGVKHAGFCRESDDFYLSLYADGWAAPRPEVRVQSAQVFKAGKANAILRVYGTDMICGFDTKVGKGRAIVIAADYICDIPLFKSSLEKLGANAALGHDCPYRGIFMTSTVNKWGERFLHILNLDGFDKEMYLYENGRKLLGGRKFLLQSKDAVMLPIDMKLNNVGIKYSTAEIKEIKKEYIGFRLTQRQDVIAFDPPIEIIPDKDYIVKREDNTIMVISQKNAKVDDNLKIFLKPEL
ncbi:MAG: beta-galactosidase [Clostridiales bacterium]|nr:beta-galactosidase [Clostridiales bacterium]